VSNRPEGDEIERRRHAVIHRQLAPEHLHDFFDDEGETEGEEQLRHMAEPMHLPQSVALDHAPTAPTSSGAIEERRPEADVPR
jgi:hypothetical protein